jgi:1-aminocyclopropane-1-carboxylate deaminase/D-cysteine desulfhydrase-like pyridoxal-dependent ACC family enzyme
LVTLGGIGTNHGLATAIFCDQLGLKCTLLLYYQPVTEYVKQNLLLLAKSGSRACHLMQEKEGIRLDPTYTAKAFAAVLDYCRNHQVNRGPVLYWHTYNSVDLSNQAAEADLRNLPQSLQNFIEQKPVKF